MKLLTAAFMIDVFTELVFKRDISGFIRTGLFSPTTLISQSHWDYVLWLPMFMTKAWVCLWI